MDSFRFQLILSSDEGETLSTIRFPRNRTVGHLKRFIENIMKMEGLRGDIYLVFDPDSDEMKEEYLLGGVLMPEDVPLLESIIDNHATFMAECHPIENETGADGAEEAVESIHDDIVDYLSNTLTQSLNSINNSLNSLNSLSSLQSIVNQTTNASSLESLITRMNVSGSRGPQVFGAGTITITTENGLEPLMPFGNMMGNLNPIGNMNPLGNLNPIGNLMNLFTTLQPVQPNMEDVVVGIHKDDLDALRVNLHKNFENKDSCDTCPVCIEKFKEDDVCRELKCHHLFHKDCVDHWLESSVKCPVCRNETGRGVPKLF